MAMQLELRVCCQDGLSATSKNETVCCQLDLNLCPILSPFPPFCAAPPLCNVVSGSALQKRNGLFGPMELFSAFCIFVPARPGIPHKLAAGWNIEAGERKQ